MLGAAVSQDVRTYVIIRAVDVQPVVHRFAQEAPPRGVEGVIVIEERCVAIWKVVVIEIDQGRTHAVVASSRYRSNWSRSIVV